VALNRTRHARGCGVDRALDLSRQLTEECDHLRDKYILEIVALVQTLVQSYQPRQSSGALETTRG
jgi:hypothetical protein